MAILKFSLDYVQDKAVVSLTIPGGQEFHFPHFFLKFRSFFSYFLLKLYLFSSSFWPSGWASRPPGKDLATPLVQEKPLEILPFFSGRESFIMNQRTNTDASNYVVEIFCFDFG